MKISLLIFSLALVFTLGIFSPGTAQAVDVGGACTSDSMCTGPAGAPSGPYSCKSVTDNPNTSPIEGGFCGGPCTTDAQCTTLATSLVWGGTKCTGSSAIVGPPAVPAVNGVCLELPRSGSKLADTAPATSGAGLLAIVDTLSNWVFAVFVVLAVLFVLLAAFQFVTAGGESAKVGEARQKLIWAVVGIVVALLAKGLVPVVKSIIGG